MKMYVHFRESCAERGLDEQAAAGGALPPAHFRSRNPLLDPEAKVKVSKDLKAAKKLLSEEQLVAFLHAANEQGQTHSVEMSCRALELGRTLDDLFTESVRDNRRNSGLTTALKVKRLAPDTYDITFGHHGPTIGDGGSWKVVYAKNGQVKELEKETFWIH